MNAFNFRRRATTASVEDELGNNAGNGSKSSFPGGGSSTGLSAVSPRRAAARALAASASDDGSAALDSLQQQPSPNPFARAAAAATATFRKVVRENSVEKAASAPQSNSLQRGESGLALLGGGERGGGERAAAPFGVEGRPPSTPASSSSAAAARDYEASVMRKVDRAVLPCFMALTLVNYLDRYACFIFFQFVFEFPLVRHVLSSYRPLPLACAFSHSTSLSLAPIKKNELRTNLSYASMQMSADIGLTPQQYGVGSSLFFLGYVGAQLPLVALAMRVGRVPFLAASCVVWGCCAAAFAGVKGVAGFYILRILLGVSEAATVRESFGSFGFSEFFFLGRSPRHATKRRRRRKTHSFQNETLFSSLLCGPMSAPSTAAATSRWGTPTATSPQ